MGTGEIRDSRAAVCVQSILQRSLTWGAWTRQNSFCCICSYFITCAAKPTR